jgi:alpha-beta hydrolase superfamily lysophospholipase
VKSLARKLVTTIAVLFVLALAGLLALRAWDAQRGPPLSVWHTYVPHDLPARKIAKLDWQGYLEAEKKLFEDVRKNVTDKLEPDERVPGNRYFDGSPIYPPKFAQDWNRSYVLTPDGPPAGAVVLLHGLTDTPYSLRHVARAYRARGWVAIGIRLPGHGTVPSGLSDVDWEDWSEATRLAVREARRRAPQGPLHLVGFSNGGALAMKYALDALSDKTLARPDRLVLISPMIGITAFARFAGVFGWPAVFPAFASRRC